MVNLMAPNVGPMTRVGTSTEGMGSMASMAAPMGNMPGMDHSQHSMAAVKLPAGADKVPNFPRTPTWKAP